jgi:hypothetical protein
LQAGDPATLQGFVGDLGQVLSELGGLRRVVHDQVMRLLPANRGRGEPPPARSRLYLDGNPQGTFDPSLVRRGANDRPTSLYVA